MQLSEYSNKFTDIGVEIITVTYDSATDANKFHSQSKLKFPILKDENSELIKRLGILNPGPDKDSKYYGIPYPGIFLVDKSGIIRGKFAEESYRDRPELENVFAEAKKL